MKHWAMRYIGRGYEDVGRCWGLVQAVCIERHGVEMPAIGVGTREGQYAAIKAAAHGWVQVLDRPRADDIAVMNGPDGRHVGYVVEADGVLQLLHARYRGVCADPLTDLPAMGLRDIELWRRKECATLT